MSRAAVLLVHGRNLQMPAALRADSDRVAAHVAGLQRRWLAGLADGLTTAGLPPVPAESTFFAFYGNAVAGAIEAHVAAGRPEPELDLPAGTMVPDQLALQGAAERGFQPERELERTDPDLAREAAALDRRDRPDEFAWPDILRIPVIQAALRFLGRETGVPEWVIESFFTDVAYYLEVPRVRETVHDIVRAELARARAYSDELVIVSHSLGTVVAYDLFADLPDDVRVRQFVTAGSPLGFPIVRGNLVCQGSGTGIPPVPRTAGAAVPWLNAYDVCDVVALIHPLNGRFDGEIQDRRTTNPSAAHSIKDYLSAPEVAGPIGIASVSERRAG